MQGEPATTDPASRPHPLCLGSTPDASQALLSEEPRAAYPRSRAPSYAMQLPACIPTPSEITVPSSNGSCGFWVRDCGVSSLTVLRPRPCLMLDSLVGHVS
jgi:hypothetical protein